MITLRELISDLDIVEVHNFDEDMEVYGISKDSTTLRNENLFVCIKGETFDSHDSVEEVVGKGVQALVIQNPIFPIPKVCVVRVKDSRLALAQLAAKYYEFPSNFFTLIGVTGTNGKTSTTLLIDSIYTAAGRKSTVVGTLGYRRKEESKEPFIKLNLTTPDPLELQRLFLQMKNESYTDIIMEVSSHSIKQHRIAISDFNVGIFTNITQDHLDYHKTFDDYVRTKVSFFEKYLDSADRAIVNIDDPVGRVIVKDTSAAVTSYGINSVEATVRADEIRLGSEGTTFRVLHGEQSFPCRINLIGKHNVYNALAAVALALTEDIETDAVQKGLADLKSVPGRMEILRAERGDLTIVVDYAHTPDALDNALEALRDIRRTGRIITIFGCGGDRDPGKRPKMGAVGAGKSDLLIVTSDNPRSEEPMDIIEQIKEGVTLWQKENPGKGAAEVMIIEDRREAIAKGISLARPGDIVLIAGKGHEDYQIFKDRRVHFNDREVSKELLEQMG